MDEAKKIEDVWALISSCDEKTRGFLEQYLKEAPDWILTSFRMIEMDKNAVIVRENSHFDTVYILIEGLARAVEYCNGDSNFDYSWFGPTKVIGALETLLGNENYATTIETLVPCRMMALSRVLFERWVMTDIHLLHFESREVGNELLGQARQARAFLFMDGRERVMSFMAFTYREICNGGKEQLNLTRQQMADSTGLSIKTVNRVIQELLRDGYIGRKGNRITISDIQHKKMEEEITPRFGNYLL
ncbi:MAG: Crp/Fnr family transcriptional regulator [Lachnospiraceae bacterium]